MYQTLCPRCGLPVSYFGTEHGRPYCPACGWNLAEVTERFQKDGRNYIWFLGFVSLILAIALKHRFSRDGAYLAFAMLGILAAGGLFEITRTRNRIRNLIESVAQKPGANLSSECGDEIPARAAAFREALRSIPRPRQVRPNSLTRALIWLFRLFPVVLAYFSLRDLFWPPNLLPVFPGAAPHVLFFLFAVGLWFLIPLPLKKEPHLALLVNGELALARAKSLTKRFRLPSLEFEFRDSSQNLVRGRSQNHVSHSFEGEYVCIFYDPENSAKCVAACAINHELVLPEGASAAQFIRQT